MSPKAWRGLYVIGSYDRRITLYNQQVRALTLTRCLFNTGVLNKGAKVAVVGGGAAGMTCAIAAACAGAQVTLYETAPVLLPRQRPAAHRYLHPHIYDWPADNSRKDQAGLPLLDWTAGTADAVTKQLIQEFEKWKHLLSCELRLSHTVTYLEQIAGKPGDPLVRLRATGPMGALVNEEYHATIIAVGFEEDGAPQGSSTRIPGDNTFSYWVPDGLSHITGTRGTKQRVLISGTGDGGLIDLARACIADFKHDLMLEMIAGSPHAYRLAQEIAKIDLQTRTEQQRSVGTPTYLYSKYSALEFSQETLQLITQLPQSHTEVFLNYHGPSVFTLNSAIINRLIALMLIKSSRVSLVEGRVVRIDQPSGAKQVVFAHDDGKESVLPFDRIVLRHGQDGQYMERLFPKIHECCRELGGRLAELGIGGTIDQSTLDFFEQAKLNYPPDI
ncbi:FAD-dependent oxidoreductase [Corallococcus aberystwythensis]|uniref:FAD-dependent oxidoreductase n=2 Tax=Corallococcus aberystwythensis TaxID=2316722 RepID=A0A3A8QCP1_9BACT|nr:FAD-dependent oxidoreductase [Corallococcus aberystwythensis]